jgi:hypothetical protein
VKTHLAQFWSPKNYVTTTILPNHMSRKQTGCELAPVDNKVWEFVSDLLPCQAAHQLRALQPDTHALLQLLGQLLGLDARGIALESTIAAGSFGHIFAARYTAKGRGRVTVKLELLHKGVLHFERQVHMHAVLRKLLPQHVPAVSSAWVASPSSMPGMVGVVVMEQLGLTIAQLLREKKIACNIVAKQLTDIVTVLKKADICHGGLFFSVIATTPPPQAGSTDKLMRVQMLDFGACSYGAMPVDAYSVWRSATLRRDMAMLNALYDANFPGMGFLWELATNKKTGKPPRPKSAADVEAIWTALNAPCVVGAAGGAVEAQFDTLDCPDVKRLPIVVVRACPALLVKAQAEQ